MENENKKEKFYNKKGFIIFTFIFFPLSPLGVILMWKNGFFSKKARTILTVIIAAIYIPLGIAVDEDQEQQEAEYQAKVEQEEKEEAEAQKKAEKEAKEKEEEERKQQEEEAKKLEEEKANRDVDVAVEDDFEDVDSAELNDGELTINILPGTTWSENSLITKAAENINKVNAALDFDEDLKSVTIILKGEMMDEKGNEELKDVVTYRYTREDLDEVDYDNFKDFAIIEPYKILNQAESYFIHPGILTELKDEYRHNLN